MKKQIVSLVLLLIVFTSCKPVDPLEDSKKKVDGIDSSTIQKLQSSFCLNNEKLAEQAASSNIKFYDLANSFSAVGFIKDSGKCALMNDFRKDGTNYSWYYLSIFDNCLTNASLWTMQSVSRQANAINISFVEFQGTSSKAIRLNAGMATTLSDLYNDVGMRFYKCQ